MSIRKTPLTNGEYYHVFNRGVDKREIFTDEEEIYFFFRRLQDLNSTEVNNAIKMKRKRHKEKVWMDEGDSLVSIVSYCLLPNHFHLLLKQETDDGVSKFMQRLSTSYAKFFNQKHNRNGSLFQGKFKANHISGDYSLSTVASYVNLNYKHHKINPKNKLVKSSIFEYFSTELGDCICDKIEIDFVLSESGGLDQYKSFSKAASIHFANNKGVLLTDDDFEF